MSTRTARRTERLTLHPVEVAHIEALVTISVDPETNRHRPGGPPTRGQAAALIERFIDAWRRDGVGYWAVEYDGAVVGICGVAATSFADRDIFNLYYRFSPAVWGLGVAKEAASAAVAFAAEVDPARPVYARTRPDNTGAIHLALALGFVRRPDLDGDGDPGGLVTYAPPTA